jgi:hypothetical protein
MTGTCKRCGKSYDECKFPISHGLPTINNVDLVTGGHHTLTVTMRRYDKPPSHPILNLPECTSEEIRTRILGDLAFRQRFYGKQSR